MRIPRQAALIARDKIAKTANLRYLNISKSSVPTHAFDDPDSSDDEDQIYYTFRLHENHSSTTSSDDPTTPSTTDTEQDEHED